VGRSPYALLRLLQRCIGTAESVLSGCVASLRVRAARCTLCCSLLLSALTAVRAANIPRRMVPIGHTCRVLHGARRPLAAAAHHQRLVGVAGVGAMDAWCALAPIRSEAFRSVGRNLRNFRSFGIAGGSAMGRA
jgi:hypothetical protein